MSARDPDRTSPYTEEQQAQREPGEAPRGDVGDLSRDEQLQFSQARRQERQQAQQVREQTAERVTEEEPVDIGTSDVETRVEDGELRSELSTEARGELVRGRTAQEISEAEGVDVSPEEVDTTFEGGEWDAELTTEARDRVTRQRAVEQVESEYDVEAERSDFELSDGEVSPSDELQGDIEQELQEEAEWEAKLEADLAFTRATGLNVQPDDFRIVGDEVRPNPDIKQEWYDKVEEQAQEQAAENLQEEYGEEIDPELFEYAQEEATLDAEAMAQLDEDVRAQIDAETLSGEYSADISAEDITYTSGGEVELDQDVQAEVDAERLSEEYQTDIGAQDIDYQDDDVVVENPTSLGINPETGNLLSPAEQVQEQSEEPLEVGSFDSDLDDDESIGTVRESVETPTLADEFIADQQGVEADDISVEGDTIVVDETRTADEIVGGAIDTGAGNIAEWGDQAVAPIEEFVDGPIEAGQEGLRGAADPVTSFAADPVDSTSEAIDAGRQNAADLGSGAVEFGRDVGETVDDIPGAGVVAAGVPIAAAEPTPIGEVGVGTGAAIVGTAAVGAVAADRLDVGPQTREIEVPTGGTGLEGEIETPTEPAEAVTSEIATPTEGGPAFETEVDVPDQPAQQPAELETPTERAGTQGDLTIQTGGQFAQESIIDAGELEQEETERLLPAEEISGTDPEGSVDVEEQQFEQSQDELTMIQEDLGGTAIDEGETRSEVVGDFGEVEIIGGGGAVWDDPETLERVYEPTETGAEEATEATEEAEFPGTFEETQSPEVIEDEGGFERVEEDTSFEIVEESQQTELEASDESISESVGDAEATVTAGGPAEDFDFDFAIDSPSDETGEMDREFDEALDAVGDVDLDTELETGEATPEQAEPEVAVPAAELPPFPDVGTPTQTGLDTAFEAPVESPPAYETANPTSTGDPSRPRRPPQLPDIEFDGIDAPDAGGPGWGEVQIERELPDPGIFEAEVDDTVGTEEGLDPVEEMGDLDAL